MSLRLRLTIWSTLVLAILVAIFSMFAFFAVQLFLAQSIDDNLQQAVTANLLIVESRQSRNLEDIKTANEVGAVFYTVIDLHGNILSADRNLGVDDGMFQQAITGGNPKKTVTLPDGTRFRIMMAPIVYRPTGEIVGVLQAAIPLNFTDQVVHDLGLYLAAAGVILLCIAAVGSYVLTGRTLRAVDRVTQKARQIEISQDLSQRIGVPATNDEVGHLVSTFNQMIARLQSAFEAQRRFVADSSHELRTPLTVIRSNLDLLRRSQDAQEHAELIDVTEAEVSRLNRMVNDLLYMAQMQAGYDPKPILRPVELDSLLLDAFARARSMAALKNQKVVLAHEDIASTQGDRDQLQHLLLNLVDNASKYTPVGGTITLGLWVEGANARIEVKDNGPGIPQEELPYLFDRFYRSPIARQTERSGAGLGLAIVKSIAEAHRGKVGVISRPGEGTAFELWLPLSSPPRMLVDDDEQASEQETGTLTGARTDQDSVD